MADDPKAMREAQEALRDMETPDSLDKPMVAAEAYPINALPPGVAPPAVAVAPPVAAAAAQPGAPVAAPGAPLAAPVDNTPAMVAPMDGMERLRQSIPNYGNRETDPGPAMQRVAASDKKTTRLYNAAAQDQMASAEEAGKASMADAEARRASAEAQAGESSDYLKQLNENQAQQQSQQHQAEAELRDNIEAHKKLYAQDPTRWWANANTGAKISGILGILGAGLQGKDTHKVLTDLIDRDTASLERQEANLDKLGLSKEKLGKFKQSAVAQRMTNLQNRHVAALEIVKDQLDAKLASTGNPKAHAALLAARGKIGEDLATKISGLVHQRNQEGISYGVQQDAQDKMLLQANAAEEAAYAKAHAAGKTGSIRNMPGWSGGQYGQQSIDAVKFVAPREEFINNLDKMIELAKDPTPANLLRISDLNSVMLPGTRALTGSGAQLTGNEEKNMLALQGTIGQAVAGKLVGVPLVEQLRNVQEAMAESARIHINQVAPTRNEPLPGTRFYDILKEVDERKEKAKHYADDFYKVMDSKVLDGPHKLGFIMQMAKEGNTIAQQHVRKLHGHLGVVGTMMGLN